MADYWIILMDCLKPNDQMTLEAGSVVLVSKEECLAHEKWFLDKIPASIKVNENITTESIQHSIYYLPATRLCPHFAAWTHHCTLHPSSHWVSNKSWAVPFILEKFIRRDRGYFSKLQQIFWIRTTGRPALDTALESVSRTDSPGGHLRFPVFYSTLSVFPLSYETKL